MADAINFPDWLKTQMKNNGMSQSQLARSAGVTRAAINGIITGARGPGTDLCNGIAKALRLPPEEVYRAAGLLPPALPVNPIIKQITYLTSDLPESEQKDILEFIKLRHRLAEERGTYESKRPKKAAATTK